VAREARLEEVAAMGVSEGAAPVGRMTDPATSMRWIEIDMSWSIQGRTRRHCRPVTALFSDDSPAAQGHDNFKKGGLLESRCWSCH
jgi:hypothetical protein